MAAEVICIFKRNSICILKGGFCDQDCDIANLEGNQRSHENPLEERGQKMPDAKRNGRQADGHEWAGQSPIRGTEAVSGVTIQPAHRGSHSRISYRFRNRLS